MTGGLIIDVILGAASYISKQTTTETMSLKMRLGTVIFAVLFGPNSVLSRGPIASSQQRRCNAAAGTVLNPHTGQGTARRPSVRYEPPSVHNSMTSKEIIGPSEFGQILETLLYNFEKKGQSRSNKQRVPTLHCALVPTRHVCVEMEQGQLQSCQK